MPRFSAFKYARKQYGDIGVSRTSVQLLAQVLDYGTVSVVVETPDQQGSEFVLVRTNNGAAQDPSSGRVVASGVITTSSVVFIDTLDVFEPVVSPVSASPVGTSAYYTLFIINEDRAWIKVAATSTVIPKDAGTAKKIADLLPTVLLSEQSDILFPADVTESDLYRFLYGFGLTFDELTTLIDLILPENRDLQMTRRLHDILTTGKGMPNEYTIGVAANARLHRNSGYIYRNKGRTTGVATYVESLTGWETRVVESQNKFLSLDDGSFEYSTGNWSWNNLEATVQRIEIDGALVTGPTMPYETDSYPFSKIAVGQVTLGTSTATRMSLPSTTNREKCIPVNGGAAHYLSIPARAIVGNPSVTPSIEWLDQRGEPILTSFIGNVEAGEEWQFTEGTVSAPDNAYFARLHIDIQGTINDVVHLDCMSLTEGVLIRRTNLVSNADVSDGVDGFALLDASGRQLSASSERVWTGGSSLKASSTGVAATLGVKTTETIAAVPGQTYTGSLLVNPTIDAAVRVSFDWRNDSTSVAVSQSSFQPVLDNRWTRVHYTVTAPSGVNNLQFRVETQDSFATSESIFFDGFLVEQSTNLGDFFTGTTGSTYGSTNTYGSFVYSTPEFGFVYRDPRSVTVICQPDRINLLFDPSFELPNQVEIGDPGTAYGDDQYGNFTYGDAEDLATPWTAVNGSFETTTERFLTGTRSGKASGIAWDVYGSRVPVVGSLPYSIAATASGEAQSSCTTTVYWYDYSDSFLGASNMPFSNLSGDWSSEQQAVVAPPSASYAIVAFTGSGTVYLDNAMFERADRPQFFFSGDVSNVDNTDGRWSNTGTRAYALLYNNAPVKLGRLKQTLPYYLPHGMIGRVLLWDSQDPEVQALIPRGLYDEG